MFFSTVVYKMRRSRSVKRPKRVSRRRRNAGRTVSRRRNRQSKRFSLRQSKRVSRRKSSRNRRKSSRNKRNTRRRNTRKRNTRRSNTRRRKFIGGANYDELIKKYQDEIATFDEELQQLKKQIDTAAVDIDSNIYDGKKVKQTLGETEILLTQMEKLTIKKALLGKRVELLNIRKGRDVNLEEHCTQIDKRLTDILKANEKLADKNEVKAAFAVLHDDSNTHLVERRKAKIEAKKEAKSKKARERFRVAIETVIHDVHLKKDQLDAIRNFVDAGKKQEIKVDLKRRRDEKKKKRQEQLTGVDTKLTGIVDKIEGETEHNEEAEEAEEAHAIALIQEVEATDYQLDNIANGEVASEKLKARRDKLDEVIKVKKKARSRMPWKDTAVQKKVTDILEAQEAAATKMAEEAVLQQQEAFKADDKQANCEIFRLEKRGGKLKGYSEHVSMAIKATIAWKPGEKSAPVSSGSKVQPVRLKSLGAVDVAPNKEGVNKELLKAAENGDIVALEKALTDGANPNATDEEGETALQHAAAANSVECVEALLKAKANINMAAAPDKITPLMQAAYSGNTDVVKVLLEKEADISLTDSKGKTALDYAKNGEFGEDSEIVKMLSGDHTEEEEDGDTGDIEEPQEDVGPAAKWRDLAEANEAAMTAAKAQASGFPDVALAASADMRETRVAAQRRKSLLNKKMEEAVKSNSWSAIVGFLSEGAAVNFIMDDGNTVLMEAVKSGDAGFLEKVLEWGEDINWLAKNKDGKGALDLAKDRYDNKEDYKALRILCKKILSGKSWWATEKLKGSAAGLQAEIMGKLLDEDVWKMEIAAEETAARRAIATETAKVKALAAAAQAEEDEAKALAGAQAAEDEAKALADSEKVEFDKAEKLHTERCSAGLGGVTGLSGRWVLGAVEAGTEVPQEEHYYYEELVNLYVGKDGNVTGEGYYKNDESRLYYPYTRQAHLRPPKASVITFKGEPHSTIKGTYESRGLDPTLKMDIKLKQQFTVHNGSLSWIATFSDPGIHGRAHKHTISGLIYRYEKGDGESWDRFVERPLLFTAYRADKLEEIYEGILKRVESYDGAVKFLYEWLKKLPAMPSSTLAAPPRHQDRRRMSKFELVREMRNWDPSYLVKVGEDFAEIYLVDYIRYTYGLLDIVKMHKWCRALANAIKQAIEQAIERR